MTEPPMPQALGIDPTAALSIQCMQMLMTAQEEGILVYRWPVDISNRTAVQNLRAELGKVNLPDPDITYYFAYVPTSNGRQPVLIPESDVRGFVLALAIKAGPKKAQRFTYRQGMLPL